MRTVFGLIAFSACTLVPAAAQAADTFVDSTGVDDAGCFSTADPCLTIAHAVGLAGSNDTTFVDGGPTYAGGIILNDGKSLEALEFGPGAPEGRPFIDSPTFGVGNNASASGTVRGFRINADLGGAVSAGYGITVTGNVIDEGDPNGNSTSVEFVTINPGTYTFTNNVVSDPTPNDNHIGVLVNVPAGSNVTISDNTFNGFREAIDTTGGTSTFVERNLITGAHQSPALDPGFGIVVSETVATLTANRVQQPGAGPGAGIYAFDPVPAPLTSVTMARNRVFNFTNGVQLDGLGGAVSLNGDVVANNSQSGFTAFSLIPNIIANNVTAFDNGTDIALNDATLSLNSSIVGDPIDEAGTTGCTISFSRGPTTTMGGTGCANFQNTFAPGFVDPASNNYHLAPGSLMIDAGSNVLTPPGTLDLDGEAREQDGNCDGLARRDIGADEAPCPPPSTAPPAVTPVSTPLIATPAPPAARSAKRGAS